MSKAPEIYLDNHATTQVDPRVVEAMLPCFTTEYGNAGSISHGFGDRARELLDLSRATIADRLGTQPRELVFTSGATESNNLALKGVVQQKRGSTHVISVMTEHRAVLDPLKKLSRRGTEVTLLDVQPQSSSQVGLIDLDQLADSIRSETCLVSVMWANNEIGLLQQIESISQICRARGVLLHTDATQAVGKVEIDPRLVDLMSFTAHKIYGPKGVGALFVNREERRIRLDSQIDGGGQEQGLRSGTLNVPGIVGFAKAVELSVQERESETNRLRLLRDYMFSELQSKLDGVLLNGSSLQQPERRLAGNLNCSFTDVDGEALMMHLKGVAASSGSACTSTDPEPSHVLRALGLSDDRVRASLRFGIGRFNDRQQIEQAIELILDAVSTLRSLH